MSAATITALVALGFGVMLVRRRSLATWLLSLQSLLLGFAALAHADGEAGLAVAGVILLVRACALPVLVVLAQRRTREARPVAPATPTVVRLLVATGASLAAVAALPPLGLADPSAERGAVTLLCLGLAIVATRRPALFQVLGILVAENGVYLLALAVAGGLPVVIELGVLFDLALVVTVAVAFARRIHGELGSGDTDLLRRLRD